MTASSTRRRMAAAVSLLAATTLAACSSGTTTDSASDGGQDAQTTLSFFSWENEQVMTDVIALFEEQNPDITIEFTTAPPVQEYISTLQTRILSNTAADVFVIAAENKTNLIQAGAAVDLSDKGFMDVVSEANKEAYSVDGKVYNLSVSSWGAGIAYNKDLLAEVGAEAPPATWEEFLTLMQDLKDAGITPYLEELSGMPAMLAAFLGAHNASIEGTMDDVIFDGTSSFAEQWTPSLEAYNEMYARGLVSPDTVALSADQVQDEFVNGRVAMMIAGPWQMPGIRESEVPPGVWRHPQ